MVLIKESPIKNKKYRVITPNGKTLDFGDTRYEHYRDNTKLKIFKYLDHNDENRKKLYLKRAKKIKDINGNLTYNNPERANFYAIKYLWT